jgi:predicted Zn finger-like uncharacterized protein
MLLILSIAMFIAGIVALIGGKLHLTRNRVAEGAPARVAGAVWVLPLPLAILLGFVLAASAAATGRPVDLENATRTGIIIEVGLILVCFVTGVVIAAVYGKEPKKKRRPREEDEDEDYPIRKKRRRREENYDEEEDAPVRNRRRRRDEEDEELEEVEEEPEEVEEVLPAKPTTIQTQCPGCKTSYQLPASFAGKKVRCKQCQEVFAAEETAQRGIQAAPRGGAPRGTGAVKKRPESRE